MTPQEIALVRQSFDAVRQISELTAALFYGRLFQADPTLRPLFRRDIGEQGHMLMQVLGVAVASLDRVEALAPTLHELGRRHAGYGVRDEHYRAVAEALLWTLERIFGEALTPDYRAAWARLYSLIAATMQAGAPGAGPLARPAA